MNESKELVEILKEINATNTQALELAKQNREDSKAFLEISRKNLERAKKFRYVYLIIFIIFIFTLILSTFFG